MNSERKPQNIGELILRFLSDLSGGWPSFFAEKNYGISKSIQLNPLFNYSNNDNIFQAGVIGITKGDVYGMKSGG